MDNIQSKRRKALVINYLSFVLILCIFYLVRLGILAKLFLIAVIIPLAGLISSFAFAFGKSKLWKLTHSSFHELDERETELVFRATTISYSVFTVICLILIYTYSLIGLGSIDVVLAAFLLYLAHSLPAAIIAWNQKVVIDQE